MGLVGPWLVQKSYFNAVHDGPLVKLQLDEIQRNGTTSTLLVTDSSWEGRGSMYGETGTGTWYPHQFGGECVDGAEGVAGFDNGYALTNWIGSRCWRWRYPG